MIKLINFFKKNKSLVVDILIILILGILSLIWFRGNYLISGGDFGIPFDRLEYLRLMFSSWDETYSMGAANQRQIASLIPYALWGGITQILGLSLVFWEKSLFYIWFAGAGLSMYYLCSVLGMKRLGKLFASIFYMMNPFSLVIIWQVAHGFIQMPYAFAPLFLGFYINGLQKKKGLIYIICTCFILLLTTTSAYANPRSAIIHWVPIFFYFLVVLIFQPKERHFALKFTFLFLGVWILFNFYWLMPFILSIFESISSAHSPVIMSDLKTLKLTSVKLFNAVRMLGFWSLHGGYKGEPYYSYEAYYRLLPVLLISWLIPLLTFLGFSHKQVNRKPLIFFFIFVIFFGLIGMSGAYLPFGQSLLLLYQTFPSLALLARNTFLFFGIPTYLIFAVLFGYGMIVIKEWGLKKIGKVIFMPLTILFILLFIVLVFPFWNGEVVRSEGKLWPGQRVKVPSYWWDAKKWLTEQKEFFRILPLPMSKTYNVAFDWSEGYSGGDPTRWLTSQPVLNVNTGDTFKIPELVGSLIEREADFKDVSKLLGLLNVKYLLFREDTRWEFLRGHTWWFKHNPENINHFIDQQEDLTLEKEFGKLKFYRIKPEYLLPHIYTSQKLSLVDGEVDGLTDIISFLKTEDQEVLVFNDQNEDENFKIGNKFGKVFIWQKPMFLATGEIESIKLEEAAGALIYARILPSSRSYFLVRIKEFSKKLLTPLPNKIEFEIILTSKRLREAYNLLEKETLPITLGKRYQVKEENVQLAVKMINHAISGWQIIDSQIEKITDKKMKGELLEKIEDQALVQETFLRALRKELTANQEQTLYLAMDELEKVLIANRKKFFKIDDLNSSIKEKFDNQKIVYNLEVPQDGQYEIYLRDDDILKYYKFSDNIISFAVDDNDSQKRLMDFSDNNLISIGKVDLNKGFHQITLIVPETLNLISDSSFEQGIWSGAKSLPSYLKSEISAEQSSDAFQGKFSLKLSTTQSNAAVFAPINNFRYGDFYKISFAAKHLAGENPNFRVWESDIKSSFPSLEFENFDLWGTSKPQTYFTFLNSLSPDNNWKQYEFILKPLDATQSLGLVFFAFQPKSGETVNLYDGVKIERVFTNPILLKSSSKEKTKQLPEIKFTKINPTRYQVEVTHAVEPYLLIFSEAYHPEWQASIEGEHLMVNGFANGWWIKKTGDYQIILDFKPQRIYYFSVGVSLLTFFMAIIYFLVKRKVKNRKVNG